MKTNLIIAFVILLAVPVTNVCAQKNGWLRDENLRTRQGIRDGQLTGKEIARLHSERSRLKTEAIRYKRNDGRIDHRERAELQWDNRKLNNNICRQKHDRQRR